MVATELTPTERLVLADIRVEGSLCSLQLTTSERSTATQLVRKGLARSEAKKCGHLHCRHYTVRE